MSASLCFFPASNILSQTPQITSNINICVMWGIARPWKEPLFVFLFKDNDGANDGILKPLFS